MRGSIRCSVAGVVTEPQKPAKTRNGQFGRPRLGFWSINTTETSSEGDSTPPPLGAARPRWSRLSLIAAVLALPSLVLVLLLPGWLFQRMVGFEMEGIGPVFMALFIAVWTGFLGGIFGGLAVRRLQGPEPERRGRAWAVLATAGSRGLLMVVAGALGSVVLGRGGVEGGDPEFLLPRWIAGFAATLWVAGAYLRARIRRVRQARRGRGWWVFAGGILLHLLLIVALPFSLFQAFVTFRPEVARGGGQNRRYEGPKEPGLVAQRELRLDLPGRGKARVVLRLWENGKPRDLGRREIDGSSQSTALEWRLVEGTEKARGLILRWSPQAGAAEEIQPLGLPDSVDLVPVIEPRIVRLSPGMKTNLWIFQDFDQTRPMSSVTHPDRAIEALVETDPAP